MIGFGERCYLPRNPRDRQHGLRRLRPARIEPQMGAFGDLRARQTALDPAVQVEIELIVVAHRGECGDGDEAAIPKTEIGLAPEIVEHHLLVSCTTSARWRSIHHPWPWRGRRQSREWADAESPVRSAAVSIFRSA